MKDAELIRIRTYKSGRTAVSGRELHEFLEIRTAYKDWFPRMVDYGFEKGVDFNPLKIERVEFEGGRKITRTIQDHAISISMAKELCMLQRTKRGKQARLYFLECERRLKEKGAPLYSESEYARERQLRIAAEAEVKELRAQGVANAQKVHYADSAANVDGKNGVRKFALKFLQNGYDIGQNRLTELLLSDRYIYRDASGHLWPHAKYVRMGLFWVETVVTENGHKYEQMRFTGKGEQYFINKYMPPSLPPLITDGAPQRECVLPQWDEGGELIEETSRLPCTIPRIRCTMADC